MYVPNVGENEALKPQLMVNAIQLILYKNLVIPDGNTTINHIEELPTGGGRGYAPKELLPEYVEAALAADKWFINLNAQGKAQGQYHNAALQWTMTAADVADGNKVYGIAGFARILPFTLGLQPIKVGDVVRQGVVCGVVTGVMVISGSWAAGTAAGYLHLKMQSGAFVAGPTLVNASRETATSEIQVLTAAPVVGGTGYAVGDLFLIETGTGGMGRVTAVTGGIVTAVELVTGGKDYAVATAATAKINGAGDNALTVAVASLNTAGPAVVIATVAGDSAKRLMFIEALDTPILIDTVGQPFTATPIRTEETGT